MHKIPNHKKFLIVNNRHWDFFTMYCLSLYIIHSCGVVHQNTQQIGLLAHKRLDEGPEVGMAPQQRLQRAIVMLQAVVGAAAGLRHLSRAHHGLKLDEQVMGDVRAAPAARTDPHLSNPGEVQ